MPFENVQNVLPVPELTAVAVDYSRADEGFIADQIAPMIPVSKESFKYGKWGREELQDVDRTARTIGEAANTVSKLSVSYQTGTVARFALQDGIPDEILNNAQNADLYKAKRVKSLVRKLRLGVEKRIKALVAATSNSTGAAAVWSTHSNDNIASDVQKAKENMKLLLGLEPTHMILPKVIANHVFNNAGVKDWVKYTDGVNWLQEGNLPSRLFGLQILIPGVIADGRAPGAASASIARVWDESAKEVYFLFVDPESDVQTMTALLQFRNTGEGAPFAVKQWRDPDLSTNLTHISSEVAQVELNVTPEAIYKLTSVIA